MGYCTDLTDKQWQVIENLLDDKERKRKHSLRSIFNGIFYLVKTACQWRMLPKDFAPWNTISLSLGMFICRKPNKSGTFSVQVVSKLNGKYKLEKSFGASSDEVVLKGLEMQASNGFPDTPIRWRLTFQVTTEKRTCVSDCRRSP